MHVKPNEIRVKPTTLIVTEIQISFVFSFLQINFDPKTNKKFKDFRTKRITVIAELVTLMGYRIYIFLPTDLKIQKSVANNL